MGFPNNTAPGAPGGNGGHWYSNPMVVSAALSTGGALISAWQQGKISDQQLEVERQKLGIDRDQFEFMKQQALRTNGIQERNVARMSPLLNALLHRGQEGAAARPDYARYQTPNVNNPYSVPNAHPRLTGIAGLNYEGQQDTGQMNAAEIARRALIGGSAFK